MKLPSTFLAGALLGTLFAVASVQAAPVIEYLLNESGSVATNTGTLGASGNGVLNNILRSSENQPLGSGSSVELNGVNSFVRVQNNFSYGGQLTVETWIKPVLVNNQRVIWDDWGNPGVLLYMVDGTLQFHVSTTTHPGIGTNVVTGPIATNVWQHVAGVYDGQTLRVFVNGRPADATAGTSGNIVENAVAPAIGADNETTTAVNFAGLIDDFRIHTQALSADELAGGAFVRLQIESAPGRAVLSWRSNGVAFRLESVTNLASGSWVTVPDPPSLVGTNFFVTNTLSATGKFYRLAFP